MKLIKLTLLKFNITSIYISSYYYIKIYICLCMYIYDNLAKTFSHPFIIIMRDLYSIIFIYNCTIYNMMMDASAILYAVYIYIRIFFFFLFKRPLIIKHIIKMMFIITFFYIVYSAPFLKYKYS